MGSVQSTTSKFGSEGLGSVVVPGVGCTCVVGYCKGKWGSVIRIGDAVISPFGPVRGRKANVDISATVNVAVVEAGSRFEDMCVPLRGSVRFIDNDAPIPSRWIRVYPRCKWGDTNGRAKYSVSASSGLAPDERIAGKRRTTRPRMRT